MRLVCFIYLFIYFFVFFIYLLCHSTPSHNSFFRRQVRFARLETQDGVEPRFLEGRSRTDVIDHDCALINSIPDLFQGGRFVGGRDLLGPPCKDNIWLSYY